MDLVAYAQINDLNKIMYDNGISVPRLRGLRLMRDESTAAFETPTKEEVGYDVCRELCHSIPFWSYNACACVYGGDTDHVEKLYLKNGKVNWSNIHGKKRKQLKYAIKCQCKRWKKQKDTWDKYVGRDDILYIHARVGGNNWKWYECDTQVECQPWFLEKVDDAYDCTYCDIYAKIVTKAD